LTIEVGLTDRRVFGRKPALLRAARVFELRLDEIEDVKRRGTWLFIHTKASSKIRISGLRNTEAFVKLFGELSIAREGT